MAETLPFIPKEAEELPARAGQLGWEQNGRLLRFLYKGVWEFQEVCAAGAGRPAEVIHRLSTVYPQGSLGSLNTPQSYG